MPELVVVGLLTLGVLPGSTTAREKPPYGRPFSPSSNPGGAACTHTTTTDRTTSPRPWPASDVQLESIIWRDVYADYLRPKLFEKLHRWATTPYVSNGGDTASAFTELREHPSGCGRSLPPAVGQHRNAHLCHPVHGGGSRFVSLSLTLLPAVAIGGAVSPVRLAGGCLRSNVGRHIRSLPRVRCCKTPVSSTTSNSVLPPL